MTVDQGRAVRRVEQPVLLDVDVPVAVCRECGTELQRKSTGRPGEFCGPTCRSRAHRRRGRIGSEAPGGSSRRVAFESIAAGVAAAAVGLAHVLDGGVVDPRAALDGLRASVADLLSLADREVAAARNETPGAAAPARRADRDGAAAAPDGDPGGEPDAFRGGNETADDPAPVTRAPESDGFRGGNETPASGPALAVPVPAAAGPQPVPRTVAEVLRAAAADPRTRYGDPDRIDDLALTIGDGLELGTWTAPEAADVQLLLHNGTVAGWTVLLPEGGWGRDGRGGHAAVVRRPGRAGEFVLGDLGRPRVADRPSEALELLHRAVQASRTAPRLRPGSGPASSAARPGRPPAVPAPVQSAPVPAAAMDVPVPYDLALGRPTGWTPPTERGLGTPDRSYALGGGLVHLTWPDFPGVQGVEQHGRLVGWAEEWDHAAGTWSTLLDGRQVIDAADNRVLLSATPVDAVTLLVLADQCRAAGQLAEPRSRAERPRPREARPSPTNP
ncbi:hypothetical protein ACI1MP_37210 (plasmid) [Kitasatospora griseola]|uniref:hypothetical protein n=1 Tax=Kitasatospora griseola TaxID=2064 RepID=UPI00385598B8